VGVGGWKRRELIIIPMLRTGDDVVGRYPRCSPLGAVLVCMPNCCFTNDDVKRRPSGFSLQCFRSLMKGISKMVCIQLSLLSLEIETVVGDDGSCNA